MSVTTRACPVCGEVYRGKSDAVHRCDPARLSRIERAYREQERRAETNAPEPRHYGERLAEGFAALDMEG